MPKKEEVFPKDWGATKKRGGARRPGSGRPVVLRRCLYCGREMGTAELRKHKCVYSSYAEVAKHLAHAWDLMQEFPVDQFDAPFASSIAMAAERLWALDRAIFTATIKEPEKKHPRKRRK
jgi:hypothetical protein